MQKSSGEGGVVAIFIRRNLEGLPLNIYGDGCQTRDLLYVEDCAEFVCTGRIFRQSKRRNNKCRTGKGYKYK